MSVELYLSKKRSDSDNDATQTLLSPHNKVVCGNKHEHAHLQTQEDKEANHLTASQ